MDRSWPAALRTDPTAAAAMHAQSTHIERPKAAAGGTIGPSVAVIVPQGAPSDLRPPDQMRGPSMSKQTEQHAGRLLACSGCDL